MKVLRFNEWLNESKGSNANNNTNLEIKVGDYVELAGTRGSVNGKVIEVEKHGRMVKFRTPSGKTVSTPKTNLFLVNIDESIVTEEEREYVAFIKEYGGDDKIREDVEAFIEAATEAGISVDSIANAKEVYESVEEVDELPGGLADGKSPGQVAKKHNVSQDKIIDQLEKGIKVEMEHTNDEARAREIALDHLMEMPDYYDRLDKIHEANSSNEANVYFDALVKAFQVQNKNPKYDINMDADTITLSFVKTKKGYMDAENDYFIDVAGNDWHDSFGSGGGRFGKPAELIKQLKATIKEEIKSIH